LSVDIIDIKEEAQIVGEINPKAITEKGVGNVCNEPSDQYSL